MIGRIIKHFRWRIDQFVNYTLVDLKYGIETRKGEKQYLEDIDSDNIEFSEFYETVKWRPFSRIINSIPVDYRNYVFIDAGSGKGRALVFSTRFNFKRIIGVELSEKLHNISSNNIRSFKAKTNNNSHIECICSDITDYTFPIENLVIFVNNPFNGKVMDAFLDNVSEFCKTYSKEVYLAYRAPLCRSLVDARENFTLIDEGHAYLIYKQVVV